MKTTIAAIQRKIVGFDHACSGTIARRSLVCGKANCRCKAKLPVLHGPYYYWGSRQGGKLVQKVLPPDQAKLVGKAIRNYRTILQLLRKWEAQTVRIITSPRD